MSDKKNCFQDTHCGLVRSTLKSVENIADGNLHLQRCPAGYFKLKNKRPYIGKHILKYFLYYFFFFKCYRCKLCMFCKFNFYMLHIVSWCTMNLFSLKFPKLLPDRKSEQKSTIIYTYGKYLHILIVQIYPFF